MLICFAILFPIIFQLKTRISKIFFHEEEEILLMEEFLIWAMFHLLLYGIFYNLFAIYRAYGFQKTLTPFFIIILLIIGLPSCFLFCLPIGFGLEIYGVWSALFSIDLLLVMFLGIKFFFIDWKTSLTLRYV
jgi:Na+-driven multidrug efflux pump